MVEYCAVTQPCDESFVADLHQLCQQVFGDWDRDDLVWRLAHMPDVSVQVARVQRMVGFKVGYALAPTRYYSWLGGIHPEHRRQGIALGLMGRQHHWARSQGYKSVETTLVHTNAPMLQLNLRAGLEIVGTYLWNERTRVIMAGDL